MVSHIEGERLIIAATLDTVHDNDVLHGMPVYMPILSDFSIEGKRRREFLMNAMDRAFTDEASLMVKPDEGLHAGRRLIFSRRYDTPSRVVENVSLSSRYGFRSLASGLGSLSPNDVPVRDKFLPHIVDTKEYRVRAGESISFASVALMSLRDVDGRTEADVIKSIALEKHND